MISIKCQSSVDQVSSEMWNEYWLTCCLNVDHGLIKGIDQHLTADARSVNCINALTQATYIQAGLQSGLVWVTMIKARMAK